MNQLYLTKQELGWKGTLQLGDTFDLTNVLIHSKNNRLELVFDICQTLHFNLETRTTFHGSFDLNDTKTSLKWVKTAISKDNTHFSPRYGTEEVGINLTNETIAI